MALTKEGRRKEMATRRLARIALLASLALILFVLEAQLPIPIAGVKLGLANLVTLTAMRLLSRRDAALVLIVRVLLGSFVTGTLSALAFSAAGGAAAFAVMALLIGRFPERQLWVVSVFGSIAHMAGQMAVAVCVAGTASILAYGLLLMISAIVTGAFNGLCAMLLCRALRRPFGRP